MMNGKRTVRKALSLLLAAAMMLGGNVSGIKPAKADTVTEITDTSLYYKTVQKKRVSVHDPSVIKEGDTYYIFGSHMAWAKSTDLENWTTFTNNINKDYKTLFASEFAWAAIGDNSYDPSGNMWAPDVIWNEELNKWCMYMSINGMSWNSSICMLTADHLDGNWTRVGTVVYSGFGNDVHDYKLTDYREVTGDATLATRYVTDRDGKVWTGWQLTYGAHAIDPCVFYDEEGQLWMSYGSWSGGIYIFRLDNKTGLRDNSAQAKANYTDAYMGKKIGGSTASGEASYIEYINGYYYLFLSYGGLVANGGYNMRVFRSQNPDGPYTDISGDDANKGGGTNGTVGTRLMSYYKWSFWKNAQVAQGHNSAFVDDDGNAYVVYHTRTDNGTEYHSVRVHQLFTTENGYLVAAPFEYTSTDTVKASGYSTDEIAGDYEILFQKNTVNEKLEYNEPQNITLTKDGKVTGDVTGKWEEKSGSAQMSLTIDNVTYEGTFVEQDMEGTNVKTLCFTTVGTNEICLWGAKYPKDEAAVAMAGATFKAPLKINAQTGLETSGIWGTKITWSSDSGAILSDGTILESAVDRKIDLKATISKGNYQYTKDMKVTVEAYKESGSSSQGSGNYYYQDYESNPNLTSLWTVTGTTTLETGTSKYVKIVPTGSGNRGAVSTFGLSSQPSGAFDIETDVMLTSSTGNSGSTTPKTQFAFACEDKTYDGNVNAGITSGYILKLEATGASNQTFIINDNANDTVILPATDWIHVKVSMNSKDLSKGTLTLTNLTTGKQLVSGKEIKVNGEGKLEGLYILLGRGTSSEAKVDNTVVGIPGIANYDTLDARIARGRTYLKLQQEKNVYTAESAQQLQKAVEAAESVSRELQAADQQTVDDAANELEKALEALTCITHVLNEGVVTKEATTTTEGIMTYSCYQCSHTETKAIPVKQAATPKPAATATAAPSPTATAPAEDPDEETVDAEKIETKIAGYLGRSITLKKGKKVTVKASVSPSDASRKVKYKSSNANVAAVSAKGVIQAKKAGTAKITITSADGNASAVYKITVVNKAKKVTSFKLSKTKISLKKGKTATLGLKSMTKGGTDTFKFNSSKTKVAKVDSYGVIKGMSKGTATVSVTCGKKKVKVTVTVK